ncbi:hypothetical protein OB955_13335 [Halobacteria archaeon AArc-m2/3/4]|uniref:Uncharacterized protein n=1 Tax=Natronoglomus mannanivorans TaxID=2979990 RepID=A0AAP3E1D3_9EURY|nr:hypothetical protein [Halobacteria archaeon AArc-xg1-1]MCU4973718.1 hypothetical protein [Halobacteria archaeon AArc-m2/3/4]
MKARPISFAVAAGLGVLGLGFVAIPGLDPGVSISGAALTGLGVLALAAGGDTAITWINTNAGETRSIERERIRSTPTPGDEFDQRLASVRPATLIAPRYQRDHYREAVSNDLRETAVDVLEQYRQLTRADAERALESGDWTTDPVAGSFFTASETTSKPDSGVSEWVTETVREESSFEHRVSRVTDELARIVSEATTGAR